MMKYSLILLITIRASAFASRLPIAFHPRSDDKSLPSRDLTTRSTVPSQVLGYHQTLSPRTIDDLSDILVLHRRGSGSRSGKKSKSKKNHGPSSGSINRSGSGSDAGTGSASGNSRGGKGKDTQNAATASTLSGPSTQPQQSQSIGSSGRTNASAQSPSGGSRQQKSPQAQSPGMNPTGRPPRPASSSSLSSLGQRGRAMSRLSLLDTATSTPRKSQDFNKFDRFDKMERWEQMLQPFPHSPPESPKSPSRIFSPTSNAAGPSSSRGHQTPTSRGSTDSLYGQRDGPGSESMKRRPYSSPKGSTGSPSTSAGGASPMYRTSNFGSTGSLNSSPMASPREGPSRGSSARQGGGSPASQGYQVLQEASQPSDSRSGSPTSSRGRSHDTPRGGEGGTSPLGPSSPRARAHSPDSPRNWNPIPGQVGVGLSDLHEVLNRPRPAVPKTMDSFITHNKDIIGNLRDMVGTRTPAPQYLIDSAESAKAKARKVRGEEREAYARAKQVVATQPASHRDTTNAVRDYTAKAREAVHFGHKSLRAKQEAAQELPGTDQHELAEKYVKSSAREFSRMRAAQEFHQAFEKQHSLASMAETGPPRKSDQKRKFDLKNMRDGKAAVQHKADYLEYRQDYVKGLEAFSGGETSSEDEERPL